MLPTPEPSIDVSPLHTQLQRTLHTYQQLLQQSHTNQHSSHTSHHPPHSTHDPPLDHTSLIHQLIHSTQHTISLHTSLSQLTTQYAKQTRQLDRVTADNQRLRRENDVCIDQLFLHSVPVEGVEGGVKLLMDRRRRSEREGKRRIATDRTTFLSGFESTDEDDDEEEGEEDGANDSTSQTSASGSDCPSRADATDSHPYSDLPNEAAVSTPAAAPATAAPQFDALLHSLANHPSIQQINSHLHHIATLLTLQASQPLPTTPTSQPAFHRSSSTVDGGVLERSTELGAVMEVRVQLQRERTLRSRRIVGQLRQLLLHRSAEMTAMRTELDILRSAAYDSYIGSTARDTLQLHECMEGMSDRPTSQLSSHRAAIAVSSRGREEHASVDVSEVCDVQQMCGLLDGVMRHVQESGVRSQSYVEELKRLCVQQSHLENGDVNVAT